MTGRGVDQALPVPGEPRVGAREERDAETYLRLAERASGPISRPVAFDYVWGAALKELRRVRPHARIINLETSITTRNTPWPNKRIHYRMHPDNVACLTTAQIDCCVLANNHVLDFGYDGLAETLVTLHSAGLRTAGAGDCAASAAAPAVMHVGTHRRVLVFAFGSESSGIPRAWRAVEHGPGVNLLNGLSASEAADQIERFRRPGDIVVASVHWGPNFGVGTPSDQRAFAHALIDRGAADLIHGHSSHHPKGVEIYRDRPILYGCGDFLNDYEGLGPSRIRRIARRLAGRRNHPVDLALMYFATMDVSGRLTRLEMTPFRIKRFSLQPATRAEATRLKRIIDGEGRELGTWTELAADNRLLLRWR